MNVKAIKILHSNYKFFLFFIYDDYSVHIEYFAKLRSDVINKNNQ